MKNIAMLALMLNLGVASIHAQPATNLTVSGSAAASTVSLLGTRASEYQLVANGAPGPITLRVLSTSMTAPQVSTSCPSPKLYFLNSGGAGVYSQDGDVLKLSLTGGSDCIDLAAGQALCTRIFQIIGGTGRFTNSSGTVTLIMTVAPVLADGGSPVFFAVTGTVSGVPRGQGAQGAQP